jgi:glycosyltransferase involved in cell wall biosynthesis
MTIHVVHIIANSSSVPYFIWFAELSKKNPQLKFSFICLHHERPQMFDEIEQFNCDCYWINFDHTKRKRGWISAIIKLIFLFKKIKPDIVNTHLFDDSVPSLMAAKLAGVRFRFITKQDTAFHWFYTPKAVALDRLNNKLATHIIAVSEECKKFILENEKADPQKVTLIHHGIKPIAATNIKKEYQQELISKFKLEGKIVIGTIARFIHWKGHEQLLQVAEKITQTHPDVIFLFTGTGELQNKIEHEIKVRRLSKNVLLTGYIDRVKIPSLFSILDIYIHAAHYEPFGFVIPEAMMNRVPVLCTRTGAAADAINHKENGYLVDYNNIQGFVEGIEYLLANNKKAIGEKAKITALQMYTLDKMWSSYLSLYQKSIKTSEEVFQIKKKFKF